jgi:energy-coupling factor transporter ATP-binding protein EcfA2
MITSIEIENLRGIRTGRLEGLAPLTVLTGPNACGKSTILDALLIAASPDPADAVGRAVSRHPAASGGARWLFRQDERQAHIVVTGFDQAWERRLEWHEHCGDDLQEELIRRRSVPPYCAIQILEELPLGPTAAASTAFGGDNQYVAVWEADNNFSTVPFTRLVDPGLPIPLHRTFTEVTRSGRRDAVHDLLSDLIPGFEQLEIIALTENDFGLAVTANGSSVPLALSGDGIQAFTQLALEIAVAPKGLVLVEEPEVYQHPKAIRQGARVLIANMRRDVQVVLTTHSLELIDALLAEIGDSLHKMALFNLALEDGELRAGRRAGQEIEFARATLENDLR